MNEEIVDLYKEYENIRQNDRQTVDKKSIDHKKHTTYTVYNSQQPDIIMDEEAANYKSGCRVTGEFNKIYHSEVWIQN